MLRCSGEATSSSPMAVAAPTDARLVAAAGVVAAGQLARLEQQVAALLDAAGEQHVAEHPQQVVAGQAELGAPRRRRSAGLPGGRRTSPGRIPGCPRAVEVVAHVRLQPGQPLIPLGADRRHPRHGLPQWLGREPVASLPALPRRPAARPASSSAARCLAIAWRVTGSSRANSVAVPLPRSASSAITCRRVGSASAANVEPTSWLTPPAAAGRQPAWAAAGRHSPATASTRSGSRSTMPMRVPSLDRRQADLDDRRRPPVRPPT